MATNTQVSGYAAISQYLFQVDTLKKNAFFGGGLDNVHAKALFMIRKAFDWGIANNVSTVDQLNPYVYSLCGAQLQKSIAIYNGNGGSPIPSPVAGLLLKTFDSGGSSFIINLGTSSQFDQYAGLFTLSINQVPTPLTNNPNFLGFALSFEQSTGELTVSLTPTSPQQTFQDTQPVSLNMIFAGTQDATVNPVIP